MSGPVFFRHVARNVVGGGRNRSAHAMDHVGKIKCPYWQNIEVTSRSRGMHGVTDRSQRVGAISRGCQGGRKPSSVLLPVLRRWMQTR